MRQSRMGEWVSVRQSRLSLTGGVGQCETEPNGGVGQCETEPTVTDWGEFIEHVIFQCLIILLGFQ